MEAELGKTQPEIGLGLKKFDLNNSDGGLTKVPRFQRGLQMMFNNFYFWGIALLGLN